MQKDKQITKNIFLCLAAAAVAIGLIIFASRLVRRSATPDLRQLPTDDGREHMTYMSSDGFQIRYNALSIEAHEIDDHTAQFVYLGPAAGTNMVSVSYIPAKQPEEVLYELTSSWGDQESITRLEGIFPGTSDKWGYWRIMDSTADGSGLNQTAIAGEYNGGVLMFEIISHVSGDDGMDMAVSDTLSELINSITYDDFRPQTMYSYYPGTYQADAGTLTLSADHTGTLKLVADTDIMWGSNYIQATNGTARYDFTIEGDMLYLDYEDRLIEFAKSGSAPLTSEIAPSSDTLTYMGGLYVNGNPHTDMELAIFRNNTGDVIYAIYELGRHDYGAFATKDATTADGTTYTQILASENKTYGYYFNEDLTSGILVSADGQVYDALALDETVARDLMPTINTVK